MNSPEVRAALKRARLARDKARERGNVRSKHDPRIPVDQRRAALAAPWEARAPLPAGMMSTGGLYSGHGALIGPVSLEAWLAWIRRG